MSGRLVSRSGESRAVADFLATAGTQPSGLVLEGGAGIGKTTLWLAANEQACDHGFRVLAAQVAQAESRLAYAAVVDLLADADSSAWQDLPEVQRIALDRILFRANGEGPSTHERVVAAAFLSVLERLVEASPVLVSVDDAQWLDPSSRIVLSFAARRLKGPVGVMATERSEPTIQPTASWLQLGVPDAIERITVRPLGLAGLHALFLDKLGRTFPRPTMMRIADVSGGNPFYALELARALGAGSLNREVELPPTLVELVRRRIESLDDDSRDLLLVAAAMAEPTVDQLAQATGTPIARTGELLEEPESHEIIAIEGNRVRFCHPLLARGVYTAAKPARRRAVHRALSEIETMPELKARHLALATVTKDTATLQALDAAADSAAARGARAAAADLLELAIQLGGDTPQRRILAAQHHFRAGDTKRAEALLAPAVDTVLPGPLRAFAFDLLVGMRIYDAKFLRAAEQLNSVVDDARDNPEVLVQTLLMLSFVQLNVDELDESFHHAREAVALADGLDNPSLTSQALAMWVRVNFMCGNGVDEPSLRRALELEAVDADVPIPLRASAVRAVILAEMGALHQAHEHVQKLRRRCVERGAERDMIAIDGYGTWVDIWLGRFRDAADVADAVVERAEEQGGDVALVIPLSVRAVVAAYTGRESEARADACMALEISKRAGGNRLPDFWPAMTLGFLETSLGNYGEALTVLRPALAMFEKRPSTEIMAAWYIPDAVEAMTALNRLDDAVPLIEALERNGRRHDRAWMLAVGARCRAMWLAAQGDVAAADQAAREAMTEHERLPMPFERARTQLLVGQLQRRRRKKDIAAATLGEALRTFEELGARIWAERTRAELARTDVRHSGGPELTPSERRVAELVASGMTSRDVAAALFISPKTVEHNLTHIYRKLGIHSRAELGQRIRDLSIREFPDSSGGADH